MTWKIIVWAESNDTVTIKSQPYKKFVRVIWWGQNDS